MSDRGAICYFAIMIIGLALWIGAMGYRIIDFETRITALEQSQCVAKDLQRHADIKFEACMSQLRGKTP